MNSQTKALLIFLSSLLAAVVGLATYGWVEYTTDIPFYSNYPARGFVVGVTAATFFAALLVVRPALHPIPVPVDSRNRRRR